MKFLFDVSQNDLPGLEAEYPELYAGQLITPLSRYANAGTTFAIDNGAFSRFDATAFCRLLEKHWQYRDKCLWVAAPDVVGSARRTLEAFRVWEARLHDLDWPVALVAQDGIEDLDIPWDRLTCIFIGGTDRFKDSPDAIALVKTAQLLGKATHVGRVNSPKRFMRFHEAGADTCDGSGASKFSDAMLPKITRELRNTPEPGLFDEQE